MPSSTLVTQAGSSRPLPETLDQAEPAGADVRGPSRWHSVGIVMPGLARRLEDRLVRRALRPCR